MPIYTYRCASCGFEKDHLQKLNDSVLLTCPQCHQDTYEKQVTAAAGFLLKGSGWYATDFKEKGRKTPEKPDKAPEKTELPRSCHCCPGAHTCAGS
ncbi:MAG: zinc ribbon domain-containing protein [Candidatus Accumulibacter sp.]|nr:zinc ribbon domain-containing protein [Accumulibacter sp.]